MDDDGKPLWYSFETEKQGAPGEFMEWPVRAITPQGAAEVLRMLLEHRPKDVAEYRIKVRRDA